MVYVTRDRYPVDIASTPWYNVMRRVLYLCGIISKNPLPESNHEKYMTNQKCEDILGIFHQYSFKLSKSWKISKDWEPERDQIGERWWINAMGYTLDWILEQKKDIKEKIVKCKVWSLEEYSWKMGEIWIKSGL